MDELYKQAVNLIINKGFLIPNEYPTVKPEGKLYRYRKTIKYAIDEILSSHIHLSDVDSLNDPFDSTILRHFESARKDSLPAKCWWRLCFWLDYEKWYKEIKEYVESEIYEEWITMDDFFTKIGEKINQMGYSFDPEFISKVCFEKVDQTIERNAYGKVACFSESWDNIPMWGYYANSHKGICLEYEPKQLLSMSKEFKTTYNALTKVTYSNIRYYDESGVISPFIKSEDWRHEREWRLFYSSDKDFIDFPCLTAVYLGDYSSSNTFHRVLAALKKVDKDIKLYYVYPDRYQYKFNKREVGAVKKSPGKREKAMTERVIVFSLWYN